MNRLYCTKESIYLQDDIDSDDVVDDKLFPEKRKHDIDSKLAFIWWTNNESA